MTTARWTRRTLTVHLGVWTSIGVNYSTSLRRTWEQILERYMLKFSKGGKASAAEMHQDDKGLLDPEGGDGEDYLVQGELARNNCSGDALLAAMGRWNAVSECLRFGSACSDGAWGSVAQSTLDPLRREGGSEGCDGRQLGA